MRRTDENRFVHSANLFKFCKEALNIKHNFEVKVIDQHVGGILGYDPADCSHWKKGKKHIRSISTIDAIANHLELDFRAVTDLVSGRVDLEESLQDYRGYGDFQPSLHDYDEMRREHLRNQGISGSQNDYRPASEFRTFEEYVSFQREACRQTANELLTAADVRSCPVMIPELLSVVENVTLREDAKLIEEGSLVSVTQEDNKYVIRYRPGEMKAHLRFLVARELGRIALYKSPAAAAAPDSAEIRNSKLNMFASLLLIPSPLLPLAVARTDYSTDLVQQLADFFWVSRAVVTARLKDFVMYNN